MEARTRPIQLDVESAAHTTAPWLPLYGLQVAVQFDQDQHAKVGESLNVTIVQNAWGVKGDRLPKLASQLKSKDFTVYAEKSSTSWRLVQNGQILHAQRIEPLTLIPLQQGRLDIPPLKISWWNVSQHRKAWSEWPGASVEVQPTAGVEPNQIADEGRVGELQSPWIWIIVTALVSFVAGWWLGHRGAVWKRWKQAPNPLAALGDRFRPHQWLALRSIVRGSLWLRRHLVQVHPVWLEVMLLRSHIRSATDAHALEHELQAFAHHTLGLSENLSIQGVANKLAIAYPNLDESRLRALLGRLDAALYGNEQPFMINDWKRDFEQVLHRLSFRRPHKTSKSINDELPDLNPGHPGYGGDETSRSRNA